MSDWKVFSTETITGGMSTWEFMPAKRQAIIRALDLERRQHCRIQIIEGQDGELVDRRLLEREHLKKPPWYLGRPRLSPLGEGHALAAPSAAFGSRTDTSERRAASGLGAESSDHCSLDVGCSKSSLDICVMLVLIVLIVYREQYLG